MFSSILHALNLSGSQALTLSRAEALMPELSCFHALMLNYWYWVGEDLRSCSCAAATAAAVESAALRVADNC